MNPSATRDSHLDLRMMLATADLIVEGQLSGASNATLLCSIDSPEDLGPIRCVYKPRRGERPLWDFASGTLGHRELATAILSDLLGWGATPITVWRDDGPFGPGMCQEWVVDDVDKPAVDVLTPGEVPDGWRIAFEAQAYDGSDVVIAHEDSDDLKRIAILDIVANNADRKGGHVLRGMAGRVVGIDHGLTFHCEPKYRTVLWGWTGESIDDEVLSDLADVRTLCRSDDSRVAGLANHMSTHEFDAFTARLDRLLEEAAFPEPDQGYPHLPWPPM